MVFWRYAAESKCSRSFSRPACSELWYLAGPFIHPDGWAVQTVFACLIARFCFLFSRNGVFFCSRSCAVFQLRQTVLSDVLFGREAGHVVRRRHVSTQPLFWSIRVLHCVNNVPVNLRKAAYASMARRVHFHRLLSLKLSFVVLGRKHAVDEYQFSFKLYPSHQLRKPLYCHEWWRHQHYR